MRTWRSQMLNTRKRGRLFVVGGLLLLTLAWLVISNHQQSFELLNEAEQARRNKLALIDNQEDDKRIKPVLIHNVKDQHNVDEDNVQPMPQGKCSQVYPKQTPSEHDTFNIYKQLATQKFNGTRRRMKNVNETLQVFIMPFTHVDPGWLKTFDEYSVDTDAILDNMASFMPDRPKMRFTWCEIAFFERWWIKQNATTKEAVKGMVKNGQIEITSGSWVMTDEANPYFPVSVDNIVEGQQFLDRELGIRSRVMWSNDPFGYGPSVPYLFNQVGIRQAVINRVHHGVKGAMQSVRAVPFEWKQYFDEKSAMLTHMLPYNHYDILNSCGPDPGSCCQFDFKRMTHWGCPGPKPEPITSVNVEMKSKMLREQLKKMADLYETNVLLMVHGDDFRFDMIQEWHQHYDNFLPVFDYLNGQHDLNIKIRFGTYSDYFTALEAVQKAKKITPATVVGDFFPYRCALGDYWTGYFTTRPFYKQRGQSLHSFIRAADLISASALIAGLSDASNGELVNDLRSARRSLSLFQHHDAITGTSKIHVMSDYSRLLYQGIQKAEKVIEKSINAIAKKSTFQVVSLKALRLTVNGPIAYNRTAESIFIEMKSGDSRSIAIFNSLPHNRMELISLRVNSKDLKISDTNGKTIRAQIEPVFDEFGVVSQNMYLLVFIAEMKPLSTSIFQLSHDSSQTSTVLSHISIVKSSRLSPTFPSIFRIDQIEPTAFQLKMPLISTVHNSSTGLLESISTKSGGIQRIQQTFEHYVNTRSGAYTFAPMGNAVPFVSEQSTKFLVIGSVRQTAFVSVDRLQHAVSIVDLPGIHGEQLHTRTLVNFNGLKGELVTRLKSIDRNISHFFTDSIGLQMLRREYFDTLPIQANYFPMPTGAFVQDGQKRMTIASDVQHGITANNKIGVEIMLERYLPQDDGKGLGQDGDSYPVDILPVTIAMTITFEQMNSEMNRENNFAYHTLSGHHSVQSLIYKPIVLMSSIDSTPLSSQLATPTIASLPCDIQLITIRPLDNLNRRLLILFRPGIDCSSTVDFESCSTTSIDPSIREYLIGLGVKKVQKTSLNGLDMLGEEEAIASVTFSIAPMQFSAFLLNI